jgi:hypothetical protein
MRKNTSVFHRFFIGFSSVFYRFSVFLPWPKKTFLLTPYLHPFPTSSKEKGIFFQHGRAKKGSEREGRSKVLSTKPCAHSPSSISFPPFHFEGKGFSFFRDRAWLLMDMCFDSNWNSLGGSIRPRIGFLLIFSSEYLTWRSTLTWRWRRSWALSSRAPLGGAPNSLLSHKHG